MALSTAGICPLPSLQVPDQEKRQILLVVWQTRQKEESRGDKEMLVTSNRTNELLAQVVERFRFHSLKTSSDNPIVAQIARDICEVELWEMWALTQICR
jgi:hypothetical protein